MLVKLHRCNPELVHFSKASFLHNVCFTGYRDGGAVVDLCTQFSAMKLHILLCGKIKEKKTLANQILV